MANILAIYGTTYGQTERIVRRMADVLVVHGHKVTMWKGDELPPDLSLHDYDAYIVASPVIGDQHLRYIREFARHHAAELNRGPTVFVSVSGAAKTSPEQAAKYVEDFLRETRLNPEFVQSFAGAMAYTKYGFFLRWMTKLVSWQRGGPTDTSRDHDMTDWEAVDRFARRLAETFSASHQRDGLESVPVQSGSTTV